MMKPRSQSSLPRKVLGIALLLVLVGSAVVFLAINTVPSYELNSGAPNPNVAAGAPLTYWYPQENQYATKNAAGTFEIKVYIVTGLKFYLFYVVQTNQLDGQPGNQPNGQPQDFQLAAFSSTDRGFTTQPKPDEPPLPPSPTADLKRATPLPLTSNRVIATYNNIDVRLAILDLPDRPEQLITFQAIFPGQPGTTLELTPIQQINLVGDNQMLTGGGPDYNAPFAYSDVKVQIPIITYDSYQIGVLKIFSPGAATTPLYFRLDQQGNLNPFSQADCATVFPPQPTNPPPKDNDPVTATIAVPAPCNR